MVVWYYNLTLSYTSRISFSLIPKYFLVIAGEEWPNNSINNMTDSLLKLCIFITRFPNVFLNKWDEMLPSISIPYFLKIRFKLTLIQLRSIGFEPYRLRKINWLGSFGFIFSFILFIIVLRSGLILIRRVFPVFLSLIVNISISSKSLNRSWSKSEMRNPEKTPMANSKQYLYSQSLSSLLIKDRKSFQSKLLVVVLWPFSDIYFSF